MKVRIKGNSIRYRLTQSEVKTLAESGFLAESTQFGPDPEQTFTYVLESIADLDHLSASFDGHVIKFFVPSDWALDWHESDRIGFEQTLEVAPGVALYLLLEKDFTCLEKTSEDQSDNYPHPNPNC
jgi:hypothetical protein